MVFIDEYMTCDVSSVILTLCVHMIDDSAFCIGTSTYGLCRISDLSYGWSSEIFHDSTRHWPTADALRRHGARHTQTLTLARIRSVMSISCFWACIFYHVYWWSFMHAFDFCTEVLVFWDLCTLPRATDTMRWCIHCLFCGTDMYVDDDIYDDDFWWHVIDMMHNVW